MLHLMESNREQVLLGLQHIPGYKFASLHDHPTARHLDPIGAASARLELQRATYRPGIDDPEEKHLADAFYAQSAGLGLAAVARARQAMEVVTSLRRSTAILREIANIRAEQSAGIEQVNEADIHMDQLTQQNAALVEESAAAAESLRDQDAAQGRAMNAFRLGAGDGPAQFFRKPADIQSRGTEWKTGDPGAARRMPRGVSARRGTVETRLTAAAAIPQLPAASGNR